MSILVWTMFSMYIQFILSRIGLLAFLVPLVIFLRCVTYIYTLCYIQAIQQFKLAHCKVSLHLNSWSNILTISTQNLVCCCCCFFFLLHFLGSGHPTSQIFLGPHADLQTAWLFMYMYIPTVAQQSLQTLQVLSCM